MIISLKLVFSVILLLKAENSFCMIKNSDDLKNERMNQEVKSEKTEYISEKEPPIYDNKFMVHKNNREFSIRSSGDSTNDVFLPVKNNESESNEVVLQEEMPIFGTLTRNINQKTSIISSKNFDSKPKQPFSGEQNQEEIIKKLDKFKKEITIELEERNKILDNQIAEINREISSICYYLQKFQKQIKGIQQYEKQINEMREMMFILFQRAIFQNQELGKLNKRIDDTNKRLYESENAIAMINHHLMQSAICPPGFIPQLPQYSPTQGFAPQSSIYLLSQQQKSFNQLQP